MKKILAMALSLIFVLGLLAACGANKAGAERAPMEQADYIYEPKYDGSGYDGNYSEKPDVLAAEPSKKMIYTGRISISTVTFDESYQKLQELVAAAGGYFESNNVETYHYRNGSFTVRIPAEKFFDFYYGSMEGFCVTNQSYNANDVSEAYADIEIRLSTQKIKLERLQDLLTKANTMYDIIELEKAISETELIIEQYEGNLRSYDGKIQYATLSISMSEVSKLPNAEEAPIGFGAELGKALKDGWNDFVDGLGDFVLFLAYHWEAILLWGAILVGAFVLIRKGVQKKKSKATSRTRKEETKEEGNKE